MLPSQYHHQGEIGEERAFNHEECGDTRKRLYVQRTPTGYKHHCHNCAPAMSGFTRANSILCASEIYKHLQRKTEAPISVVRGGPKDFSLEIPLKEKLWLEKWITAKEIRSAGIGYSKEMGRVVFPIYDNEQDIIYWQARSIENIKPKYKNKPVPGTGYFFSHGSEEEQNLIIVEAIISAIVVGRVAQGISVQGSYIPREIYPILRDTTQNIFLWLDPDKQKQCILTARRLEATLGKPVRAILTNKKPKEYRPEQITEILRNPHNNLH